VKLRDVFTDHRVVLKLTFQRKGVRNIKNVNLSSIKKFNLMHVVAILVYLVMPFLIARQSYAVSVMSEGFVRLDRLKASTATGATVCMKPSATHTTALHEVAVTFPSGFTVNSTGGNWTGAGSTLGGATAMPGIAAATPTVSSQTVTWTFASDQTVSSGTMYCFTFSDTSTLTTSTAGNDQTGTLDMTDATPANSESVAYELSIVANDQVTVDADVPATFTFTVPDTSLDHGTLSASTVDTDTQSSGMIIQTNAENGWVAWLKVDSTNGYGLYSASTGDTIGDRVADGDTLATAVAGTEDWLIDVSSSGGTVATEFDGNETDQGGRLPSDGSFQQIASSTTVSSSDTVTLQSVAAISATNKAASDYQETLTVVAAGNF
jgi:hypothetical protein